MGDVNIKVRGATFLGWKDVTISRSLEALSASFALSYIDAWEFRNATGDFTKWYLKAGDPCEIFINSNLLITGYIDEVNSSYDGENRTFSVAGRDKTADLVDCAASTAETGHKSYQDRTVAQMAKFLIAPFGIELVEQYPSGSVLRNIAIEPSQTVFNVLELAARQRGLLLTTDNKGRLVITKPAAKKATVALIEGGKNANILSGAVTFDYKNRFSKYYVYGQTYADTQFPTTIARQSRGIATDPKIDRHRPKVLLSERQVSQREIVTRAQWESKYQAAKSVRCQVRVNGWRQGPKDSDALWDTNMLVDIDAPDLALNGQMLIESLTYRLSEDGGEITELTLTRPDAWVPNPIVKDEAALFIRNKEGNLLGTPVRNP